jgi:DNA (cytosine-5)-methyltransferase 1
MSKFKMIDLFAGVGGFTSAFKGLADCNFCSEWDDAAASVYRANHSIDRIHGDITQVSLSEIPAHDILCGGFPCQPFSVAGLQKGFDDKRGVLFLNIAEILDHKRPRAFILENVKNLVSHDKGNTFALILDILKNTLKYHVAWKVLNTSTHGDIPHNRERVYIVGFIDEEDYNAFSFPDVIPLTHGISSFLNFHVKAADKYYQTNMDSPSVIKMHAEIAKKYVIYQYRRYYVRENKNDECPTLTANMGSGGHNVPLVKDDFGIRKLTPRECFTLQGYPSSFVLPPKVSDSELYKQAGNTISVPVVVRLATAVIGALTHE